MLTYLRVQSLHASSLQVCIHMFLQYYMLLYLPADDVNCIHLGPISLHLSSDNCVDVDACGMSNYEMWFYDVSELRRHL